MSGLIPGICGSEGIEGVPGRPGSCGAGAPGTVGAAGGALPDWGWLWSVPGPAAEVRERELERRAVLSGQREESFEPFGQTLGSYGGAARNTGGKLTYGKVLGHKVAYVVAKGASFALYLHDDTMVMVGSATLGTTKALLTAVIKANE